MKKLPKPRQITRKTISENDELGYDITLKGIRDFIKAKEEKLGVDIYFKNVMISGGYDGEVCVKYSYPESDEDYNKRLEEYNKRVEEYDTWFNENQTEIEQDEDLKRQEQEIISEYNARIKRLEQYKSQVYAQRKKSN